MQDDSRNFLPCKAPCSTEWFDLLCGQILYAYAKNYWKAYFKLKIEKAHKMRRRIFFWKMKKVRAIRSNKNLVEILRHMAVICEHNYARFSNFQNFLKIVGWPWDEVFQIAFTDFTRKESKFYVLFLVPYTRVKALY